MFYYAFDLYIYIYIIIPSGPMWGVYLEFSTCVSAIFKLRWLRILLNTLTARMCSIGNFPCLGNAGLSVFRIRVYALPFPARKALLLFLSAIYAFIQSTLCLSLDSTHSVHECCLFCMWPDIATIYRNKKEGPEQVLLDPKGREARAVISQKKKHSNPPYEL